MNIPQLLIQKQLPSSGNYRYDRKPRSPHDIDDHPQHEDAIAHGNRLIMMMEGKIILDIQGEEKKKLTVKNLLDQFEKASGEEFSNDSALLG